MNIAIVTFEFVSETNFAGGLANYTYKLAKWLAGNGHEVTVFLTAKEEGKTNFDGIEVSKIKCTDHAGSIDRYFKKFRLGFLYPERVKYFFEFRQYAYSVNKVLRAENKKKKIDIIHYPHVPGYAFYRPKNIPTIVRLSSSTALCKDMGGYGSSNLYMDIQDAFEIKAMKKADAVFGPSKMIAKLIEPAIEKKITIIETPYIDPPDKLDQSVYEKFLKGKKYVLFFGAVGLIKGVGTIAEIIKPLLEKHPDLFYVFIGKKVNNLINGLTVWDHLITKAGNFSDRIIHIPPQQHVTLFPLIQNALLVTLPSRTDNFPNTCIESMSNKKIVIGTKGNGFDQLIDHGKSGFVIDVDDHEALLFNINLVLNLSEVERTKIENKAFERTLLLDPKIVLSSLVELYKKTINEFKN